MILMYIYSVHEKNGRIQKFYTFNINEVKMFVHIRQKIYIKT